MANEQYNSVLVVGVPLRWRDERHAIADGEFFAFLVEELIARSAVQVAVGLGNAVVLLDHLPSLLKRRVCMLDDNRAFHESVALLRPFSDEFEYSYSDCVGVTIGRDLPEDLGQALLEVFTALPPFLLAMHHSLQLDFPLQSTLDSLRVIRRHARDSNSRAIAASLEGILSTYSITDPPSLILTSSARGEAIEVFSRLIEDEHYLLLSENARSVGFPSRLGRALQVMRRTCSSLLTRKWAKGLFSIGSGAIQVATSIPTPDSEAAARLLERGFLPPIVDLTKPLLEAVRSCERANPETPPQWFGVPTMLQSRRKEDAQPEDPGDKQ